MLEKLVLAIMVTLSAYLSVGYKLNTDLVSSSASAVQPLAILDQSANAVAVRSNHDD